MIESIQIPLNEREIRKDLFKFISQFNDNLYTKLSNVNGKVDSHYVPYNIFTKRTKRANRVLIPWQDIVKNNLSIQNLQTFFEGVTVEFLNDDFFNPKTNDTALLSLYNFLKSERIGSDEHISAIISFHSEGTSCTQKERDNYNKFIDNTKIKYKNKEIIITKNNIQNYYLKSINHCNTSNKYWTGFIFIDISGGKQDSIKSHIEKTETIFNPACEYANEHICNDIDLTMGYYVLNSIQNSDIILYSMRYNKEYNDLISMKNKLKKEIEEIFKQRKYSNKLFKGSLYDFIKQTLPLNIEKGKLFDPIQLKEIYISNFSENELYKNTIDVAHNIPVSRREFYWDSEQKCILSSATPTNLFWSFHLSNMMQQELSLEEYFKYEKDKYLKRLEITNKK